MIKGITKKFLFCFSFSLMLAAGCTRLSDAAVQRQQMCKDWGFNDQSSIDRCAQSDEDALAVVGPKVTKFAVGQVIEFNRELSQLTMSQPVPATFRPTTVADLAKVIGPSGLQLTKNKELDGQYYAVAGRIVVDTPSPESMQDDETHEIEWKPRTYWVWGPMPDTTSTMPPTVDLDIESLNRSERAFIQRWCEAESFTGCTATILGHIGITNKDEDGIGSQGIVADEVVLQPIDAKAYRLNFGILGLAIIGRKLRLGGS